MEVTPRTRTLGFLCFLMSVSTAAAAQQDDYDPKYDDQEAAGSLSYSDEEAAGSLNYSNETAAGGAETGAPAGGAVDADADIEAGGSVGMDAELPVPGAVPGAASTGSDRAGLKPWQWGASRHLVSVEGPTGLFYTLEAGSDEGGTFGLGFHGGFFKYRDYLYNGDTHVHMSGALNLRITPIKYLEIYTGFESQANYNDFGNPELFQTLGDFQLGLKGNYAPVPFVTLGLIVGAEFKNPVGEVDVSFKGVTVPLGFLTTFDFAEINEKVPLRTHLNFIYRFDNSANLIEDIEKARGGCGTDEDGVIDENGNTQVDFDGCLDPVERKGLDIDRTDQFRIGIGLDAAFPYVTPLVEWNLDIPVNRQDVQCPDREGDAQNSCMKAEGISGMRQWFTFGIRVLPPVPTLSIDIGVDVGVTGYAPSVHEVSPQAPYKVMFGLTYAFDPFPPASEPVPVTLPPPAPELPPPPPYISGYVHDADSADKPVPGATITYVAQDLNPQVANSAGRFRSYDMPVGRVTLQVSADGYETASFDVDIPDPETAVAMAAPPEEPAAPEAGVEPTDEAAAAAPAAPAGPAEADAAAAEAGGASGGAVAPDYNGKGPMEVIVDCPLKAKPKKGTLLIRATDDKDALLSGVKITLDGPTPGEKVTDESGDVSFEVDVGTYTITAEKEGYFKKVKVVDAALDTVTKVKMPVAQKPKTSSVSVTNKRINIKKQIHFETNSAEIKLDSHTLMNEIAEVLLTNPSITKVEIQGHTDNKGKADYNVTLSQERAESVRRFLIEAGVEGSRLEAKGFGPKAPLAPNITAAGRAKNRRVEFHIVERSE